MYIGLSGSFGSGKSSVLKCFEEFGASVVDADAIVASIYKDDTEFLRLLREKFGDAIFHADGKVDRKALGSWVFSDADELKWLEKTIHPRVNTRRIEIMRENSEGIWIAEIPLLFEKNLEKQVDRSISVVSSYSLRVDRLKNRGFDSEEVEARSRKQLPQNQKISRADYVILNDGSFEFLKRQVQLLFERLQQ
ncbi:MAG: dephospho-CoA kinase [Opitutaceae bacterium]|nr:dephospho-CoA kinase [Opitutaceae bacterium]